MKHKPLRQQRSNWMPFDNPNSPIEGEWFSRQVGDGLLMACVADEPGIGWHLSISFRNHRGELTRYPNWDEQYHAVHELLPHGKTYAMYITPEGEYVAWHDTTFHWHEVES